jgi:putative PEP-CTERM system histidine kinase
MLGIGIFSYAAAALAFLVLAILLITSWRGRIPGALLILATLLSMSWSAAAAYQVYWQHPALSFEPVLEVLRSVAWCAFLIVLLVSFTRPVNWVTKACVGAFALFCILLAAMSFSLGPEGGRLSGSSFGAVVGRVILSVIGLALVEQLYRNTPTQKRWEAKFLCLGLGGMFAYDFFLYADAMLLKRVEADFWSARGFVNALVVPLIAVSARRNPQWSFDIFVSRRILFHTATLMGAGLYLLLMAAAGYYIQVFGGDWGRVLQAAFLFGALVLLGTIVSSGMLRARLRVFLSKHFFRYGFDYREEWLRFTRRLSEGEPGIELRVRAVQAIAELAESPGGALSLVRDGGVFECAARWNMPAPVGTENIESPFCRFLEERDWVISLEEYETQPERYSGLKLPQWLRSIPNASLVVPLMLHERLLGFLVLARSLGGIRLNWEVNDLLKMAGRQAAGYLGQLEAAEALLVARQFESFSRMSAFVVHDLKNLVAQLSLMLSNAVKHRSNPEFQQDMISTVEYSVEKMRRLLAQLHGVDQEALRPARVKLEDSLQRVIAAKIRFIPAPSLEVADPGLHVIADPDRFERVIGHLVQNAIEAAVPNGEVVVRLTRDNGDAVIKVCDNGRGMSEEFVRERLFRPFASTKAAGMGIGAYETREYIRELGGRIEVKSAVERGTEFRVILPLAQGKDSLGLREEDTNERQRKQAVNR